MKENYSPKYVIALDESDVCSNMVGNTTVNATTSQCLFDCKSEWNEDETIVFQGAKRETAPLNKDFKQCCVVASPANGWMNEELTLLCLKRVIGSFCLPKRLLAWDISEAHMTDSVRKLLKEMRIDDAPIPGGCSK